MSITRRFIDSLFLLGAGTTLLTLTGCNDVSLVNIATGRPTAIVSGVQQYGPLDTATFDGSNSTAISPKMITAYEWSISSHPSGSTSQAQPVGNGSQVEFFVDLAGNYKIKLKVTDSQGLTDSTEYAFSAVPSQSLHVELTWPDEYTRADMDLHLINKSPSAGVGGVLWNSMFDCHFTNCKPDFGGMLDWGVPGNSMDNPTLDIDNITDSLPENVNIKNPADGVYEINVHYYGPHTNDGTVPVVHCHMRVYLSGAVVWEGDRALTAQNQVWNVGDVTWNAGHGTFSEINTIFTTTGPGG